MKTTTQNLIIRDHLDSDLESHHRLLTDGTAMYYLQDIKTSTLDESRANLQLAIDESHRSHDVRECYFFRIENKHGVHVGEIGFTVLERTPVGTIVEAGYFLHKEFWGRGYASEALSALLDYAFQEAGAFRVTTGCCKENLSSERVMIKCGMTFEGELKQVQWHDGRMKDRVLYRMLKSEWKAK